MKIMRSLVFLLVIYVLFCNNTNAEAASKAKEAKIAYAKYLQSVCPLDENIFWLIDINKDNTPELITAWNEGYSSITIHCVYTFKNGKIKRLANTIKKSSVIRYGEGDISYNSRTKTIAIYDGGTSNNNSFYAIAQNGKLKKVGEIGYHWYDDNSTVRKPFLNGKWISKKKYNSTSKAFKKLTYHKNTYKNRTKFLAKVKSKKVKLFNVNGKENMVSMKIKSVKRTNQGIILTGTGKCPVDVVRTKKQREQLEKGKIKALGKMWFVKKSYDEGTDITSYYLYSSQSAKEWSYVLTPTLYILKHPYLDLMDTNNNTVYRSVGKIKVCVKESEYCELMEESAHETFCHTKKWKGKWVPLELNRGYVKKWIWE